MRTFLIILAALALLGVGFLAGFLTGVVTSDSLVAALGEATDEPEGATITVGVPSEVKVGEKFSVVVTVTNLLDRPRTIGDVDVELTYLSGFTVKSVSPAPGGVEELVGYRVHTMNVTVPPRGTTDVAFTLVAVEAGAYAGDVDVYVDSDLAFATRPVRTVVTERR